MAQRIVSDFGKAVKCRLIELDRPQTWLIDEVKKKTGLFFDRSYLWKTLSGDYLNQKIVSAICEILDMPDPDG